MEHQTIWFDVYSELSNSLHALCILILHTNIEATCTNHDVNWTILSKHRTDLESDAHGTHPTFTQKQAQGSNGSPKCSKLNFWLWI